MKFWAAASLALLLMPAAAQERSRDYLVRLPDAEFPANLRASGITPLHHEGKIWAVRASEKALRQSTEEMTPATSVTIELQPAADITEAITNAGGLVTRTYQSVSAVTAFLPTSKIGEIQRLPGVKRVHKSRAYRAFQASQE